MCERRLRMNGSAHRTILGCFPSLCLMTLGFMAGGCVGNRSGLASVNRKVETAREQIVKDLQGRPIIIEKNGIRAEVIERVPEAQ